MDEIAERSQSLVTPSMDLDSRAANTFEAKSVTELRTLYAELQKRSADSEANQANGGDACECDVAFANLLIIVGFAINKLDGEGRYQDWMQDDSLEMLEDYHSFLIGCAKDAGAQTPVPRLTAQLVKDL